MPEYLVTERVALVFAVTKAKSLEFAWEAIDDLIHTARSLH